MAPSTNGWEDTREEEREALDLFEESLKTSVLPQLLTVGALQAGDRFKLAGIPEVSGTVVRIGLGSALVRYDGKTRCHVESKRTGEVVDFERPKEPVTISLNTVVIAL
jgi:hypothetical protein